MSEFSPTPEKRERMARNRQQVIDRHVGCQIQIKRLNDENDRLRRALYDTRPFLDARTLATVDEALVIQP